MPETTDNQITVTESGAFIPRNLFGHDDEIVSSLRQAGVISAPTEDAVSEPISEACPPIRRTGPIDLSREMKWLQSHRYDYIGQWVAVDGDRLIAHSSDAREVYRAARAAGLSAPFVEQILSTDALPFGGW